MFVSKYLELKIKFPIDHIDIIDRKLEKLMNYLLFNNIVHNRKLQKVLMYHLKYLGFKKVCVYKDGYKYIKKKFKSEQKKFKIRILMFSFCSLL